MTGIRIRPKSECRWDIVSLGEVMIRLDPGEGRIRTSRQFRAWEGGGEYNVARGLARCFGMDAAVATAIVDNEVGRLLSDLIRQGGVDQSHVRWAPFDGIGQAARNGLNFTERGYGVRAAAGCSDRGHTAVSQLRPGDIDWRRIFEDEGARVLHCGGIFAALSASTPEVAQEAMEAARAAGTIVSYDLNYRPSLWKSHGGKAKAREVNRRLAELVDVMIGNEEDFGACLGFEVEGVDEGFTALDPAAFKRTIAEAVRAYPNFKVAATTLREVRSASINDWGAVMWHDGAFHEATRLERLEIMDRVGGGDSFASGLLYGMLAGKPPAEWVEYGAAHGALAMTTPGDTSMASLAEVEALVRGASARIAR